MEAAEFESLFPALTHRIGHRNAAFLAGLMGQREVLPETILIEDHARVASLYLVVSGEFRVEVESGGHRMEIGCLRVGKWLGEVSLFSDEPISTSRVVANQPSRVLELSHADFLAARAGHPELVSALTKELIDTMAERVRATDLLLARAAAGDAAESPASMDRGTRHTWLRSVLQTLTGAEG
jgi:CRP-like cAMP-binding protein